MSTGLLPRRDVDGFALPKEEARALVESEPRKFLMPKASDLRYTGRRATRRPSTTKSCVSCLDAWRMVVPKRVARSTWH